jgi:hypothetical protein
MSLRWEPPQRLPLATVPSSKDGCLLQLGIAISQVGLYFVSVPALICFFVMTPISAC